MAFRLGDSAEQPLAQGTKWTWEDRTKSSHKIVHTCIEQEYRAHLLDFPAASITLKKHQKDELAAAVSAQTVLPILRRNCGEDWMKAVGFGEDEDQAEKRMERVIVSWLKRKLAVDPKSSRQKKGLAVDLHAQWDRGTPQVFQSQRVIARWTDGHGNVSASPWNGHYKASVVGDAACAGEYRLLFDPHLGPDGTMRPAQEHPCVPIKHIDHKDERVWE